ncbi:sigma-70 family RNA polymerase sigma factor [Ornithinibacillus californiensis]|uniref:sigma-70 family RNA polymerase sigma factor n=1 Tax=Ornithinibacillus californiensis TaxID=161536 RepID=UPI00064E1133|nr:sigma-70 family RNA polymerase sigma factor [Ornithinibacillus californiensis]
MDLEQIYLTYFHDLYRYIFSLTRNHAEAEDLVQETFTKAHMMLLTNEIKEIKPWLFKVGYHTYIDRIRKEKRHVVTEEILQVEWDTPEDAIVEKDSFLELLRYLDKIKPIEKQAILLCDLHDCTYQQAAAILNLNLNTLKSYVTRGRKKMKKLLVEEEFNESL